MYLKLKEMRKLNKYTGEFMANKLNISKPYYSQIESGHRKLSYELAFKISNIFNCKPDEIFYEDYKKKTKN